MPDETTKTQRQFYSSKVWQHARGSILIRDSHTCQMCGCILRQGRDHPRSAAVDHKAPLMLAWEERLNPNNLWAVCKQCHESTCAKIERQYKDVEAIVAAKEASMGFNEDGKPKDPNHPWNA